MAGSFGSPTRIIAGGRCPCRRDLRQTGPGSIMGTRAHIPGGRVDPNLIILALSAVVIGAYAFEIVGRKVRLPSVVLLIVAGVVLRRVMDHVGWSMPYLHQLLPVLGTIGLV